MISSARAFENNGPHKGRSSFPTTAIRIGGYASWLIEPCSCGGLRGVWGGSFGWSVFAGMDATSRRTHGSPEDLLDDWGHLRVPVVFPQITTSLGRRLVFIRLLLDSPARAVLLHALLLFVGETGSAMAGLTSVELT